MKRAALCLSVVMLSALALGCNQDRAVATQLMNDGLNELKAGRTADATKKLEESTMKDPTYADPPYYLAQIYHQKYQQLEDAEDSYATALKRDPENAQFLYRYGAILAEQGKHAQAIDELKKAVEKHEDFPKAWFRLGASQIAEKQYVDGVASLTESIKRDARMKIGEEDPGGAAFHALGDLYLRFYFYDKALKVYANGIENNPTVSRLYRGQGVAQLKLKRFADAETSLKKAIELDRTSGTAYFNLAIAQRELGKTKEALDSLEKFLGKADPTVDAVRMSAAGGLRAELRESLDKK
jgi:Tfp pilus assembly protein PilF